MTGVAIVGVGTISKAYLDNLLTFPDVKVIGCADLDVDRAKSVAAEYSLPVAGDVDHVIDHPDVELVVNLTIPVAHAAVAAQVVEAGRHVYNEKPLVLDPAQGRDLLAAAERKGVRVGCAPDTFLGAGLQSVQRAVAGGAIGTPTSAIALLQGPGPESWHPNPRFYFQPGGGPLLDMGPYYLTALAVLLGPVTRVAATGSRAHQMRTVGRGPLAGTVFDVEVLTHVSALLQFAGGQSATAVFSFDSPLGRHDFLELTGTEATLAAPDPNQFGGPVRLRRTHTAAWEELEVSGTTVGRGIGVLDMVRSIRSGEPHRASGELALHIVDVMTAILRSAEEGSFVPVTSTFTVPSPLQEGWDPTSSSR